MASVGRISNGKKWRARGSYNGSPVHIGTFRTRKEALEAAQRFDQGFYHETTVDDILNDTAPGIWQKIKNKMPWNRSEHLR